MENHDGAVAELSDEQISFEEDQADNLPKPAVRYVVFLFCVCLDLVLFVGIVCLFVGGFFLRSVVLVVLFVCLIVLFLLRCFFDCLLFVLVFVYLVYFVCLYGLVFFFVCCLFV
jgi:hypothetical protein